MIRNKEKNKKFFCPSFYKKTRHGFLEMPFGWLFGIIVGAIILFLAIYVAMQLIKTEGVESDVIRSKEVGILLNPLEIGFESGKTTFLELPAETRFDNGCDIEGNFGMQKIQMSQKSFGKWSDTGINVSFPNKYIFSESSLEGQNFYIFSKPFDFPFKVADLIYLIPKNKNYCFIINPGNISKEIRDLKLDNVLNVTNQARCIPGSVSVCFVGGTSRCNISVNIGSKTVTKGSNSDSFEGDTLMYAAIFSDPGVYRCQVRRLMKRVEILANIYDEKAIFIARKNCDSSLGLVSLMQNARDFDYPIDLSRISSTANQIKIANENSYCKLW